MLRMTNYFQYIFIIQKIHQLFGEMTSEIEFNLFFFKAIFLANARSYSHFEHRF